MRNANATVLISAIPFRERSGYCSNVREPVRNYSIVGPERELAIAHGLADARWRTSPIARESIRALMERRNAPAVRDTIGWFALLGGSGFLAHRAWGTWWMIPAFFVYGTLYGSVSDSRWHECGHRTAFRTTWLNDTVYYLASFMVWREAVSWRWSHVRHHSDTIVVGRDPEIAFPRPMTLRGPIKECFGLSSNAAETKKILYNVIGRLTPDELDYLPDAERAKAIRTARVYAVIWLLTIAIAIGLRSAEPLMFVIGPSFYGRWLLVAYGITQHAGLAEDTIDHRLNSRTVRMNRVHRYLYWNMNFHTEHHMFPLVPFHALPALHAAVKGDLPPVYSGFRATYREIWSVYRRQANDPSFFIDRTPLLPTTIAPPIPVSSRTDTTSTCARVENSADLGWVDAGPSAALAVNDVIRFDQRERTFALYRLDDGRIRASDGLCTHALVHLCDGLVRNGEIECPKHNGRFDIETGHATGRPAKVDLRVYNTRERAGRIEIYLDE